MLGAMKLLGVCVAFALGAIACKGTDAGPAGASSAAPAVAALGPREVLDAYLSEKMCADRGRYILHAKENADALAEHYKTEPNCIYKHGPPNVEGCEGVAEGAYCKRVRVDIGGVQRPYCLQRVGAGFKIDWRCSVGFNPMTIAALKAQRPTSPGRFRVYVKLGDYYNYQFSGAQKRFYSVDIEDEKQGRVNGYVPRTETFAARLFEALKDGEAHDVTIELAFDKASPPESDGVIVVGLDALDWHERAEEFGTTSAPRP